MRNTYSLEFKAKVVREDRTLSQWRDQALFGLVSLFRRTKVNDWTAKATAHEQENQARHAENQGGGENRS